ncbi:cupin-like domain-containing protein [Paraherbaspirillum soli]|uniref:Cupin-like domain-containing protein n=1 Tax=Paraherbaspirillum soli TaxID=631222 RepID=A0ABW0M8W9_9BURK
MTSITGPSFQLVEEIDALQLARDGGFGARTRPLLVKGALRNWPAQAGWSFEQMSTLRHKDGSEPVVQFQNGLVEQGQTQPRPFLPVGPYLQQLAAAAKQTLSDDVGLLPARRRRQLEPGERFLLDWSHMQSFRPDRMYLAQWNILDQFPALRKDFAIQDLWPGWRWTWEYVFMGPANTVTGLHYDFPHNWFCQVRGTKEFILFPPDQTAHMCISAKHDWGATLSDINISRLDQQPEQLRQFEKTQGLYARVEPGDALFIPKRTWHAVVSLEPSISLGVFGLTAPEILFEAVPNELKNVLHKLHLYRWGNCTCHKYQ